MDYKKTLQPIQEIIACRLKEQRLLSSIEMFKEKSPLKQQSTHKLLEEKQRLLSLAEKNTIIKYQYAAKRFGKETTDFLISIPPKTRLLLALFQVFSGEEAMPAEVQELICKQYRKDNQW